jgi:hypothetical protein
MNAVPRNLLLTCIYPGIPPSQAKMKFTLVPVKMMESDTTTIVWWGVGALLLFAVLPLLATFRSNWRYSALRAKPPAVVSSDLLGMTLQDSEDMKTDCDVQASDCSLAC